MKKLITLVIIACVVLSASVVCADRGCKKKGSKGCEDKFFKKVKMVWMNEDELKITDEQMDTIKALKFKMKRDMIEQNAAIDLIKVDVYQQLMEETIAVDTVKELINKKYDLKKQKAQTALVAYAELKNVLTVTLANN